MSASWIDSRASIKSFCSTNSSIGPSVLVWLSRADIESPRSYKFCQITAQQPMFPFMEPHCTSFQFLTAELGGFSTSCQNFPGYLSIFQIELQEQDDTVNQFGATYQHTEITSCG